ncbi:MAG: transglycosylase domain-containing protein, partial [Myxococcota bacterium]
MLVIFDNERPLGSLRNRLIRFAVFLLLTGIGTGVLMGVIAYGYFGQDLPQFESIDDYRPKTVTRVFGQEGQLIGEFYREKRIVLPYSRIPPTVVQAFMASEDDRFFDHSGIDYWGIMRAAFANFRAGRVVQGGSTITQQVAKSLIISAEGYKSGTAKNLVRKIKEAILARRLEATLSKQDIISLYLNQIFLGNQSYGVQAAAENYFRKNVEDLNVAEIALLAGLPQAPSRYSPFRHPKEAKARREYVLRRMQEEQIITAAELEEAKNRPIEVFPAPNLIRDVAPYFTEQVRRILFDRFDEKTILEEGLSVYTTVDVERYRDAEDASYDKLRLVDKRQGYRGPLKQLGTDKAATRDFLKRYGDELKYLKRFEKMEVGELYVGVVTKIDRRRNNISLKIGPHDAVLPLIGMRWARPVDPQVSFRETKPG